MEGVFGSDTDTKTLTKADLIQFTGSEHWYRHAMVRDVLYTDHPCRCLLHSLQ